MPRPRIFAKEYYHGLDRLERQHPWSEYMQRLALELLARHGAARARRALDAGCGAGYFTRLWSDRHSIPMAVGLDSALEGLRLSRGRGVRHAAAGSVAALPFPAGAFDIVYCADVLQHLSVADAAQTVQEFARVLSSGGVLLIRAAARRGIGAKKHRDTATYQQWDPEKLRGRLEPAGFAVEWMSQANWLPSVAADLRAWRGPAPAGDPGLPVHSEPSGLARRLLETYWRLESFLLLRLGWRLPGGHTLLCVARKR